VTAGTGESKWKKKQLLGWRATGKLLARTGKRLEWFNIASRI